MSHDTNEGNTDDHIAKPYCEGIAQITFNAWSYLDANLWAGIAHSLFEKLNEYINGETKSDLERLKIKVKLSKRLQLLHSDLQNYQERRTALQQLKERLHTKKESKLLSYLDSRYDTPVKDFVEANDLGDTPFEALQPGEIKKRVVQGMNLIRHWRKHPDAFLQNVFLLGFALLVIHQVTTHFITNPEGLWYWLKNWWVAGTTALAPLATAVVGFWTRKEKLIKQLTKLARAVKAEAKKTPEQPTEEGIAKDIQELDDLIAEVKETISHTASVGNEISQLAMANFLSTKREHKDYVDRLGIVSNSQRIQ